MYTLSDSSHKSRRVLQALELLAAKRSKSARRELPTVRELSVELNASTVTVAKALRVLKDRGILNARPGRGIWVSSPPGSPDRAEAVPAIVPVFRKIPRWQEIKNRISSDILKGTFPAGRLLPLCKELGARYSVSFRPLRLALTALAQENRIVAHKKGYRVFQIAPQKVRQMLIALAEMDKPSQIVNFGALSTDFWHALERECRRMSIDLELYTVGEALGTSDDLTRCAQFRKRRTTLYGCRISGLA